MTCSRRELCTLLVALSYWRDEMLPHGRRIMRPYFRDQGLPKVTPLNRPELERLEQRLKNELLPQS